MSPSLLIAAAALVVGFCIVLAIYPLLQRDMAGTVERHDRRKP